MDNVNNLDKEKNFVSAVLYVSDKSAEIDNALETLNTVLFANFIKYEIVCVVDDYDNQIIQTVRNHNFQNPCASMSLVKMGEFQGLESAMQAGINVAIGDFVFEFDDFSFVKCPEQIMLAYRTCLSGNDIVAVAPKKNRFGSKLFYKVYKMFSFSKDKLQSEFFRIVSRRAINRINQLNELVFYRKIAYNQSGLKQTTVYTKIKPQRQKLNIRQKQARTALATQSLFMYTSVLSKIALLISIAMVFASVFAMGYTIYMYFISKAVSGWTTTILFMAMSFTAIFLLFTVLIKYMSITIDILLKRKTYKVEDIEKIRNGNE